MKLILALTLTAFLLLAGCQSTYYFKPDTALEQTQDDWLECYEMVMRYGPDSPEGMRPDNDMYETATQCMLDKGYQLRTEKELDREVRIDEGVKRGVYYKMAGK